MARAEISQMQPLAAGMIGLIFVVIALAWILFPLLVLDRMKRTNTLLRSIDERIGLLKLSEVPESAKPQPTVQKIRKISCRCNLCSRPIEFDPAAFDKNNPTTICPHCGLETQLYLPA
jgi:hypothetical protein